MLGSDGGHATLQFLGEFPTPLGMQLRVVSVHGGERRRRSGEGPQYSFSCVGRVALHSRQYSADRN